VKALRALPLVLRRLYAQAYQSYIFNRSLSLAIREGLDISRMEPGDNWGELSPDGLSLVKVHGVKEKPDGPAVPLMQLVGYSFRNYSSRFDACAERVIADEGVTAKGFYSKEMQEISVEGGFRRPFMTVRDAHLSPAAGGSVDVGFSLARGEYATVFLRELVKPTNPEASGFA
jgi:tRNA pseudouridine13 synthase